MLFSVVGTVLFPVDESILFLVVQTTVLFSVVKTMLFPVDDTILFLVVQTTVLFSVVGTMLFPVDDSTSLNNAVRTTKINMITVVFFADNNFGNQACISY